MSWINNVVPPRIRSLLTTRKDTPENLWVKCPDSGQLVFHKDLENNLFVVPGSDFHMRMDARTRLATTFDEGRWDEIAVGEVLSDPLRFRDEKRYSDKLKEVRTKTGLNDAVKLGSGRIGGAPRRRGGADLRFLCGHGRCSGRRGSRDGCRTRVEGRGAFRSFRGLGGECGCKRACSP